jgi:BASS family bile acid:Na+ symporter
MQKKVSFIEKYFYLWIIIAALLGLLAPIWAQLWVPHIKHLLGLVIFVMGITLKFENFKPVLLHPKALLVGTFAHYFIMPLGAYIVAKLLMLPPDLAIGLILMGSCPGGAVSNVMIYICRADLPLSFVMTFVSTLLAPVMIPVMMWVYVREWIAIDAWELFFSTAQIVLIPLFLAFLLKLITRKFASLECQISSPIIESFISLIAILVVCFIIFIMVAVNIRKIQFMDNLVHYSLVVFLAVVLHNALGLFLGYQMASRVKGLNVNQYRTISIEVGLQNSGLASVIALFYFSPLSVVPAIFAAAWHSISGSLLANYWRNASASAVHPEPL